MNLCELVRCIIASSEKAAALARRVRGERDLFSLLIQEKKEGERNEKFLVDFKTLADVLIQETVRHDLEDKFPGLGSRLYGEESNQFTNSLGHTITVSVQPTLEQTSQLLSSILEDNDRAAFLLAEIVHSNVSAYYPTTDSPDLFASLTSHSIPLETVGLWIDPIDSTSEYISGEWTPPTPKVADGGLTNVTVLIGVFDVESQLPFIGCVNQPFYSALSHDLSGSANKWSGRVLWGVCLPHLGIEICSSPIILTSPTTGIKQIVTSRSDVDTLGGCLCPKQFNIESAPGAGYKQLCVIDRTMDAYVILGSNTYKWDSCGPHAILRAMGGGLLRLNEAINQSRKDSLNLDQFQVTYRPVSQSCSSGKSIDQWSNSSGLLAYRSASVANELLSALRNIQVSVGLTSE